MAVHARFGRRNSRNRGSLHAGVAITAIDAVVADMMFMAELHGLLTREVLARHVGGTGHRKHGNQRQSDQKERRKDTKPCDEVRASMKNLGHVSVALGRGSKTKRQRCQGLPTFLTGKCGPG